MAPNATRGTVDSRGYVSTDGGLTWVPATNGGSGGGGAVTIADGADVTEGAIADAAVTGDNAGTVNAHLRGLSKILADVWDSVSHYLKVNIQNATLAVTQSGTWTVQPGNTANTTAWKVDGSAVTQPISAASLPLPTGAAAKVAMSVTALQVTASGDTTLVSSGTRKLKRVEASNSSTTVALTVGLKVASLNGGAAFGKKYLPASGGLAVWVFPDDYLPITAEPIVANLSIAGQVEMTAYYE